MDSLHLRTCGSLLFATSNPLYYDHAPPRVISAQGSNAIAWRSPLSLYSNYAMGRQLSVTSKPAGLDRGVSRAAAGAGATCFFRREALPGDVLLVVVVLAAPTPAGLTLVELRALADVDAGVGSLLVSTLPNLAARAEVNDLRWPVFRPRMMSGEGGDAAAKAAAAARAAISSGVLAESGEEASPSGGEALLLLLPIRVVAVVGTGPEDRTASAALAAASIETPTPLRRPRSSVVDLGPTGSASISSLTNSSKLHCVVGAAEKK